MDSLFPALPKDLAKLTDKELEDLLSENEEAMGLCVADDAEFLGDRSAEAIIEEMEQGKDHILALRAETQSRVDAAEAFEEKKEAIKAELTEPTAEEDAAAEDEEGEAEAEAEGEEAVEVAEEEAVEETVEAEVDDPVAEKVLVTASAETEAEVKPRLRRAVPTPAADRVVVTETREPLSFVASGFLPSTPPGSKFDGVKDMAGAVANLAKSLGKPAKREGGQEERFKVATLDYSLQFPEERQLHRSDWQANAEKIAAIGSPYFGAKGLEALTASGGLCAPLEPFYTMPQLATDATPVWDSLPRFRAERGGVNVPTPTVISDADGSVTVITAEEDAMGGTYALKACLDMDCPNYTETAVTIISACREFGNLNAMAWPEKIAHEVELTRAFHSRTLEGYILDQIKSLSVNVTAGGVGGSSVAEFVGNVATMAFQIRSLLRLPREARFQALLPAVTLDIMLADTVWTQFDRYRTRGDIDAYFGSVGIDPTYYLDTASSGTSQIQPSDQSPGALDGFPSAIEYALFPQGTFLGVDMAELNLGIVRDSTLNSTNDFQIFWETFQNVARIGPSQAAYWMTETICPNGVLAAQSADACGD